MPILRLDTYIPLSPLVLTLSNEAAEAFRKRFRKKGVMKDEDYAEIARADFEREIYKQCDEEDRMENCLFCKNFTVKNLLVGPMLKCKISKGLDARPRGLGKCDKYVSMSL